MRAANQLLRRHHRYGYHLLAPPLLTPSSLSPSNISSAVPFEIRNFAVNPHHSSCTSSLFSNYVAHRAFSGFNWRNSVDSDKREEGSSGSSEGRLELNPIELLETAPEMPSASSTASSQISEDVFGENTWYYYPIQAVISTLDRFHDFTGLPWWVVISISTLSLRISLLPILILQLKKMAKFGALLPKYGHAALEVLLQTPCRSSVKLQIRSLSY